MLDVVIVEHKAVFVVELEVAQPDVLALVAESVPDVAELQASVDILVVFVFLVLASLDAVEVDRPGYPSYFAVPNVDHYANSSSCAEVVY